MPCSKCGHNHPGEKCGSSPAVLQITNKDCTLFHGVTVPAIMGGEDENPPKNGLYKNVLLYYEATGNAYFYTSDGIPYKLTYATTDYNALTNKPTVNGVTLEGNKTAANLGIVVNDGTLTIKQGDTTLGTFSANASENVEINTKNSYVITLGEDYRLNFNGTDIDDQAEASRLLSSAKAEEIKLADFPSAVCYYSNHGSILNFIRATAERGEANGPGAVIDTIRLSNDGTYEMWSGNIAFQGELVLQSLYLDDTFFRTGTWQLRNLNPILASISNGTTPYDSLRDFLLSTQDAEGYVRAASYGITGEGLLLGEAGYDTVEGEYLLVAELMSLKHQEVYRIAFKPDETYTVISRHKISTDADNPLRLAVAYDEEGAWYDGGAPGLNINYSADTLRGDSIGSRIVPGPVTFTDEGAGTVYTTEEVFNLLESGRKIVFDSVPLGWYGEVGRTPQMQLVDNVPIGAKVDYGNDGVAYFGGATCSAAVSSRVLPLCAAIRKRYIQGGNAQYDLVTQGVDHKLPPE